MHKVNGTGMLGSKLENARKRLGKMEA